MNLTIIGRPFTVFLPRPIMQPICIVIPAAHGELAILAVEAIHRFTRHEPYAILAVDASAALSEAHYQRLEGFDVSILIVHPTVHRPWRLETRRSVGSLSHGVACIAAARWLDGQGRIQKVFFMHDDALPIVPWWLEYLMVKGGDDHSAVGVKRSEHSGRAHSSGVLVSARTLRQTKSHDMLKTADARFDVLEAAWPDAWCAASTCHRVDEEPATEDRTYWFTPFNCDVSLDDEDRAFYLHRGGGSMNGLDQGPWIAHVRKHLGL